MQLTDETIVRASRAMAAEFLATVAGSGLSPNDIANLAGSALVEVLAQQLGPFGAVERLREIADVLERQMLHAETEH